jgi:hypothetical protein
MDVRLVRAEGIKRTLASGNQSGCVIFLVLAAFMHVTDPLVTCDEGRNRRGRVSLHHAGIFERSDD